MIELSLRNSFPLQMINSVSIFLGSQNLSQLASINYDFVVKSAQESPDASKQSIP